MTVFDYYLLQNSYHNSFLHNMALIIGVAIIVGFLGIFFPKAQPTVSRKNIFYDFFSMLFVKFGLVSIFFWITHIFQSNFNVIITTKLEIYPLLSYFNFSVFLSLIIYLVIRDFGQWIKHRTMHKIPCLWALHKIHHANTSLSMFSDYRLHVIEVLLGTFVTYLTLMIVAYPIEFAFIAISLEEAVSLINHSNLRMNYGNIFSKIIVSPQNHRIHHARDQKYLKDGDAYNFSVILPIWDIIFGSYYNNIQDYPSKTGVIEEEELERSAIIKQQLIGIRDFFAALRKDFNRIFARKGFNYHI